MTDPEDIARYIDAASALHALPLDAAKRDRVIQHFAMSAGIVTPLLDYVLSDDVEISATFRL